MDMFSFEIVFSDTFCTHGQFLLLKRQTVWVAVLLFSDFHEISFANFDGVFFSGGDNENK